MNKLFRNLRYDWPLHFILVMTNWLPDNVVFLRLRGWLARPFLGSCGADLRIGRNVTFYNPRLISFGAHVYVANGCIFLAVEQIKVEDEVMFGPYVVLAAGNHGRAGNSYRFGNSVREPISIGRGTWVAAHACVLAGAQIGEGCVVAAGAVVLRGKYPDHTLLAGVPARVKKVLEASKHGNSSSDF
jgi:maltose O-acetyltransferase